MTYKYSCSSLQYLEMESGLFSVPKKYNFTVVPAEENDLAFVNGKEYIFKDGYWEYVRTIDEEY